MRGRRNDNNFANFAVVDIGSSKVAAAIIAAGPGSDPATRLRVAGFGLQRSRGVKAGVLINLDDAEGVVRAAIAQAEDAAGMTVEGVTMSVSCGRLGSQHFTARAETSNGTVTQGDLDRLINGGFAYAERDGRALLHMNRLAYEVDGFPGMSMPLGLVARRIGLSLHAVSVDEGPLRNQLALIQRCNLNCDGMVATPYASVLAATSEEERQLGVTCIDLGAGTTSIALFGDGRFIGTDVIPVGAQNITYDIAKALHTPRSDAERIKTLYGTLVPAQSDDHELIQFALAGEDDGAGPQTTRAKLAEIIRPRMAQIFDLVRARLAQNPAAEAAGDTVVLTGGGSLLSGLAEFAVRELGRPVRLGKPPAIAGIGASLHGPQLATLVGLAMGIGNADQSLVPRVRESGYLDRVGPWFGRRI